MSLGDRTSCRINARLNDQSFRMQLGKEGIELTRAETGIERCAGAAGSDSKKSSGHFRAVGKQEGNAIVSSNTYFIQRLCNLLDLLQQEFVSQRIVSGCNYRRSLHNR